VIVVRSVDEEDEGTPVTAPATLESESESPPVSDESSLFRDFALPNPLFASDSAWNQTAVSAPVLPQSDEQILVTFRVLLGDISTLEGYDEPATTWPYMDVNINDYTIPIFRAGDGMQNVVICEDEGVLGRPLSQFGIETEGGPVTVPAPAGAVRPAGPEDEDADGHLVLYDADTFTAYDYFAAIIEGQGDCTEFAGGMMGRRITEAGVVAYFDVRGPGISPDGESGARAHGTPLLAGLILPEDIERGEIAHALAFAIPGPRNLSRDPYEPLPSDYFYPATTTETDFYNTHPLALAAGQRIRLQQTLVDEEGDLIDESEFAPITQLFLDALRNYGAYLVDNAGGFSFYAEDVHTAVLHLSADEVNALIGRPSGSPLPEDMTKWEMVLETLGNELERIPFAISPGDQEPDPKTAAIEVANFEVVAPAVVP
ncbi:MAG: hypothetical protein ACE5FD_11055, partial [Anaerolineae bacterium]